MSAEKERLSDILDIICKEKHISKEVILEAIENSLLSACKNHFGTSDNIKVSMDSKGEFIVTQEKTVVEEMEEDTPEYRAMYISLADAKMKKARYSVGDVVPVPVNSTSFGRIATGIAKNVILQKIREEERREMYNEYYTRERDIMTGIVQRKSVRNITINLGRCDGILTENEQVKSEDLQPTERVKVYILEVKDNSKGPRITVSRSHPDLVKRLFESEVSEVRDGTVEIKSIAREAGSRTKMAVYSHDDNVDPVGACVGINGSRVNAVVGELRNEKIDIIEWDENPAFFIESALSPAKVIAVIADEENREAQIIVADNQLSLAIGKEGQNARLAAKLTNFKIDIKSETQARELGLFDELGIDYQTEGAMDLETYEYNELEDEISESELSKEIEEEISESELLEENNILEENQLENDTEDDIIIEEIESNEIEECISKDINEDSILEDTLVLDSELDTDAHSLDIE